MLYVLIYNIKYTYLQNKMYLNITMSVTKYIFIYNIKCTHILYNL